VTDPVRQRELPPRQRLRYLPADDPGTGKTIIAAPLIKEFFIRGDLERCLIVAPGNLVEQWQDELEDKFALEFELLSSEQIETSVTGKPFVERNPLIIRLDVASRSETLQAKLMAAAD
jgi:superfamily II DNA or RNA helicase